MKKPRPTWPAWMDIGLTTLAVGMFVVSVYPRSDFSGRGWAKVRVNIIPAQLGRWLDRWASSLSDENLICFSRHSLLVLLGALFIFGGFCLFGLHGSSTSLWDYHVAAETPHHGLLWGEPKQIRSDELSVFTPDIFSQLCAKSPLTPVNPTIGGKKTALFWALPVRHFIEIPRVLMWPFHIFRVDTAFSIYWNLKGLILFVGVYSLFLLVTGSRPCLSLAGALWVYFSGYTQWWYSHCVPEDIGFAALTLLGAVYAMLARKRGLMRAGVVVFTLALVNFGLIFYPPFSISVMWVMLAIGAGIFIEKRRLLLGPDALRVRWFYLFGSIALVVVFLGAFLLDTRQTIEMIRNTVYPGRRFELGGSGSLLVILSSFVDFVFQEGAVPAGLMNVCEGANFYLVGLLLLPVIFIRRKGAIAASAIDAFLGIVVLGILWFILLGFPAWLAGASFLSATTPGRVRLGMGLATVILVMRHFARHGAKARVLAVDWHVALTALGLLGAVYVVAQSGAASDWACDFQGHTLVVLGAVTAALVVFAVAGLPVPFFAVMLAVLLSHNFLINPVGRGFSAVTSKNLYRSLRAMEKREPDARWVVMGSFQLANFIKFCGVEVVNGNKFYPVESFNDALDPQHQYINVWNRYAHIIFAEDASCLEPRYELIRGLLYRVRVSARSPALQRLGVRYLLFTYQPPAAYRPAIVKTVRDGQKTFWILRRNLLTSGVSAADLQPAHSSGQKRD
ncbi:MAG: DUF7657 domain-containing protein [Chthoniobacterales bacterium]